MFKLKNIIHDLRKSLNEWKSKNIHVTNDLKKRREEVSKTENMLSKAMSYISDLESKIEEDSLKRKVNI